MSSLAGRIFYSQSSRSYNSLAYVYPVVPTLLPLPKLILKVNQYREERKTETACTKYHKKGTKETRWDTPRRLEKARFAEKTGTCRKVRKRRKSIDYRQLIMKLA